MQLLLLPRQLRGPGSSHPLESGLEPSGRAGDTTGHLGAASVGPWGLYTTLLGKPCEREGENANSQENIIQVCVV